MKIFMLAKKLHYSGALKIFMWVAKALADRGHEVTVFTYMKNDINELPANIRWIKADLEKAILWKKVSQTRQHIKECDADVSISFLLDANIINTLACIGLKTKSVICERNDPFKPHYYKLRLTKWIFRFADGAVFQLPLVAEYYSMVKGPTAVIPNPVVPVSEDIVLQPFEKREKVIASVGRLDVFQKRQDILFKAFAKFLGEHPDYTLKLYGDGPDESKLRELAKTLGIQDKVVFAGVTSHVHQVLCQARFFVLASDFEGIPNALLEAMSIGLPCISTKCRPGGAELLIQDGINGLLVNTNDVGGMHEAMQKMTDGLLADALGREAKKIKDRFSEDAIASLWCDYLKQFG